MNTHIAPRLLIPVLTFILVVAGVLAGPAYRASAIENRAWTETESQEGVPVQSCNGYDLTTSYTVNRNYHAFTDYHDGLDLEEVSVSFAGAIGNADTGKSYAYDGGFTRWSDYDSNDVTITDLQLRFEVGTPGEFSIASDRLQNDVDADPVAIIKTFVPHVLQMELCYLMGAPAPVAPFDPIANYAPGQWINVHAEDSAHLESDGNQADTCANRRRPGVPLAC
jgi:hypothetical protein